MEALKSEMNHEWETFDFQSSWAPTCSSSTCDCIKYKINIIRSSFL